MGGDKDGLRAAIQGDLEQILAIQPQYGPAVGMDIADGFQTAGEVFGGLKTGKYDQIMNFARFAVFL